MKNYIRETYLKKIRPYYGKQLIKILTGQRRVGKSFILKQISNEITRLNKNVNIIFIDKEKFEFDEIQNYSHLINYVKEKSKKTDNCLFIDEVQEIEGFEKALRSLLSDGNYDIYCTGSNSSIFSSELATFLSGRQIEIKIHGLSFIEFSEFHNLPQDETTLNTYVKYGGLPYLINLPKEDEIIFDYLNNILSTILFRDVIKRNKIRDTSFFDNLVRFIADNTGSLVSAGKISNYLKSQKQSKSVSVIINYLSYLENAYIINKVKRKDIKEKKLFETGEKYYFEDIGLRNVAYAYKIEDINKIIENLVYNHLIISGYKVFIGKSGNKEIDFIAQKGNELVYIQAAYLLSNKKVIDREFGNLNEIKDHYPKYVISTDQFPIMSSYKGIKHIKLIDFLKNPEPFI